MLARAETCRSDQVLTLVSINLKSKDGTHTPYKEWGPYALKGVPAVAVELAILKRLVEAMYALGADPDTPVEYSEDETMAYLEEAQPSEPDGSRVVDRLGEEERGARWRDRDGDGYFWSYVKRWWVRIDAAGDHWSDTSCFEGEGPYTEVIEDK